MKNAQLSFFETGQPVPEKPVNVASVPQRSPFRYPGGKTWLIPTVRQWLKQDRMRAKLLVEPFTGGGIVSLTAAFEDLAERIIMSELDPEVAAVWEVMLSDDNEWLAERILHFDMNFENVQYELQRTEKDLREEAFCTILKNRVLHGGILAKGSGFVKTGENGKGLRSRWYPQTLAKRIQAIRFVRDKIAFYRKDAFEIIEQYADDPEVFFFIDPPYTVAGKRLYTYFDIDHEKLFALTAKLKGRFMLTYDDTEEVRHLATKYRLPFKTIPMKTTHHLQKYEIIVSDHVGW